MQCIEQPHPIQCLALSNDKYSVYNNFLELIFLGRLVAHLPSIETSDNAKKQLKDTIQSPQFQQALSSFSTALQSGQLGPVVSQFQLNSEAIAAANTGDLEQFVKALEKNGNPSAKNAEKKEKSDETKQDTPMEEDKNA